MSIVFYIPTIEFIIINSKQNNKLIYEYYLFAIVIKNHGVIFNLPFLSLIYNEKG